MPLVAAGIGCFPAPSKAFDFPLGQPVRRLFAHEPVPMDSSRRFLDHRV